MSIRLSLLAGTAAAALAFSGAAWAQATATATATADLNVRTGPSPQHEIVGVIPVNGQAAVEGCIEASKWCIVNYDGIQGWAYSDYLMADVSGTQVVVAERWMDAGVPVVAYDGGVASGAATGVIAGALIGGPIGAVAGGVIGGTVGATVDIPAPAIAYVRDNRFDPVYLDGEVVVGASLPETVELRPIPDYEYHYVYVNGVPVLVNQQRQIVYVVR